MFLSGLVRPSVWLAMYRASGVSGNMKGEGRLLGGEEGGKGVSGNMKGEGRLLGGEEGGSQWEHEGRGKTPGR